MKMKDNKHIQSFNEHQENLNISDVSSSKKLNEGKNSFDYEWGEGVYINGSISHKIYFDKKLNRMCYQYPGKFGGNTVDGLLSNEDIDDLIDLLQKYKGSGPW